MSVADMHVKVDAGVKAESEAILKKIGISMSDLVNMTLRRVVYERRIPFDTQVPEVEVPENMSVNSAEELDSLLEKRMKNDDGERYTLDEVKKNLAVHRQKIAEKELSYA